MLLLKEVFKKVFGSFDKKTLIAQIGKYEIKKRDKDWQDEDLLNRYERVKKFIKFLQKLNFKERKKFIDTKRNV